jgi:hypothetical protein
MCEIIDFLEPGEKGMHCPPLMNDNFTPEAGVVLPTLPGYSELLRQEARQRERSRQCPSRSS